MPSKTQAPVSGRSVEAFRASHDRNYIIPAKIKTALEKLGDTWCYDAEFLKLASLSTSDLAMFRDQFEEYWLIADKAAKKRVWAGNAKLAAKLREMVT